MDAFLRRGIKKASPGCWVGFEFTPKFSSMGAPAAGLCPGCAVSQPAAGWLCKLLSFCTSVPKLSLPHWFEIGLQNICIMYVQCILQGLGVCP